MSEMHESREKFLFIINISIVDIIFQTVSIDDLSSYNLNIWVPYDLKFCWCISSINWNQFWSSRYAWKCVHVWSEGFFSWNKSACILLWPTSSLFSCSEIRIHIHLTSIKVIIDILCTLTYFSNVVEKWSGLN